MPVSTKRTIRLPKANYNEAVINLHERYCRARSGNDYTAIVGRTWNGNQRRKRKRFNPPTAIIARTFEANTATIHQGQLPCVTKPAFSSSGPVGPGSGAFGERDANGVNERRLKSRALAQFSSNAGLGVSLLETSGTLRSLGDRLRAVASMLNSLRRGDIRKALSTLHQHTGYNTTRARARLEANPGRNYADRLSNFWLETVFGWVPLLQSIYDSLAVLGRDYRTDRRSRASDFRNNLRVGIAAEFRTSDGNRFSKLGITNPAEVLWDAVPFSFVLDWFVPIANSIRFLGVRRLTTQIWMWSSREWGHVYFVSNFQGAPEGALRERNTRYTRTVSVPSVSTFTARLPATMWHAVTSAALIQSLRPR